MTTSHPGFQPCAALVCFILTLTTAIIGFFTLPILAGYFAVAVVAGGINAVGWIIVVKTDGRSSTGYFGLLATVVLHLLAKDLLPSGDSQSFAYPLVFVAVAVAIGSGMALLYRESKKKRANQTPEPTAPSGRGSS